MEIDLLNSIKKIKRDTKLRAKTKTNEQKEKALKFGWEYFDKKKLLEKAEEADEYRKSGKPLGALHGLPVAIKYIIGTYDMPTECGTVFRKKMSASQDSEVVNLIKNAGAIIKTLDGKKFLYGKGQCILHTKIWSSTSSQGSILGPLLFIMYTFDMTRITKQNKVIVYADDTTVLVSGRNLTETKQHCNDILDRFYKYFTLNKLSINPSKTKFMIYRPVYGKKRNKYIHDTTNRTNIGFRV